MIRDILLFVLLASGTLGCLFMIGAASLALSFARRDQPERGSGAAVTILKPLHGDQPGLFESLASFCRQDYSGPVQIIFGVTNPHDPAIRVVERLQATFPGRQLELVTSTRIAGSNPKVANLINMSSAIRHDIVVLADSDIRAGTDYLDRVVGALERSDGGAVTCPYVGISSGSLWSQLSQLNIDTHFLPSVVFSVRFKLAQPCLGSTIALRRTSLAAIGGFEAVADCLADDYELGKALRERGAPVAMLPLAVGHICDESSWHDLWRHELRWAMTIRTIDPIGYFGWTITHALPLALLALALGGGMPALWLMLAAIGCRTFLAVAVERGFDLPSHPYWLIPLRDLLSFVVFVAGFFGRAVDWKGRRYRLVAEGTLISERRSPSP